MSNYLPDSDTLARLGLSPHSATWDWQGTARNDSRTGGAGIDFFFGEGGNDTINGGGGNDYIEGGESALLGSGLVLIEALNGGAGIDTISYLNSASGVNVSVLAGLGVATGGAANGDVLIGFENIVGSLFNDTLTGDINASTIFGMDGRDTINGGAGNDILYGGDGDDTIHGNQGDDTLYGDGGRDHLFGDAGNDTFYFNAGNNDFHGGAGIDTLDYTGSTGTSGATFNLKTGLGDHDAFGDTFEEIENVIGTAYNDDFWGNASVNRFNGGAGRDRFFYDALADLNGDTIDGFSIAEGDKIDLTAIPNFDYSNIRGGGLLGPTFNISYNDRAYVIYISLADGGQPTRFDVFDV